MTLNTFNTKLNSDTGLTVDNSSIANSRQASVASCSKHIKVQRKNIPSTMNQALNELKIRAKKLLKAYQQEPQILKAFEKILRKQKWNSKQDLKLKDCHNLLAIKCGCKSWQEAQLILSGKALTKNVLSENRQPELNVGDFSGFWHSPSCDVLLNQWFASYDEAKQVLKTNPDKILLPYKRQFVVVGTEYLNILGFTNNSANLLHAIKRDLVESYSCKEWDELAKQVLMAKLDK